MQLCPRSTGILELLRASTADLHQQIEHRLRIFSPEFDLQAYMRLLARFYGFWLPLESELRKLSVLVTSAVALERRLKAHLLEADLRVFGIDPAVLPLCERLPSVQNLFSGLGCLYVTEGSTLGAQFIARHLREQFSIDAGTGGSFFNAYGGEVAKRWSDFRTFLEMHTSAGNSSELVAAARETFENFNEWLSR